VYKAQAAMFRALNADPTIQLQARPEQNRSSPQAQQLPGFHKSNASFRGFAHGF